MATVYLARDLRHERLVALKVLRPELAAILGPERFQREIRTAARLKHPHILGLYDSGETAGQLWFTMPYAEGETLRERLRREGELPVPEAVRILRDLVDALAYAHPRGVVHRDIKPENVIVTSRHAMLMDFGVAKAVSEAAGEAPGETLTSGGLAVGTPAYMAPEQATADPGTDHRADLYALGLVGYERLAGQLPFTGRTETSKSSTPPERAATILDALYADADSVAAAKVAASVPRTFARPTQQTARETIVQQYAAAQFDLSQGKAEAARSAVESWKSSRMAHETSSVVLLAACYAMLLDTQLATIDHRPDALTRLTELDSLLQVAPTLGEFEPFGNIVAARLWHERGDDARALASIRRRVAGFLDPPSYIRSLREEGRYAPLEGDRDGAIRAYRLYLTLRSDPEPAVRPKVEEVRAELAALEGESTDR